MTKTVPILGISFAAIFAIAMILPATAVADFTTVSSGTVDVKKSGNLVLTATADGNIPKFPTDAINNDPSLFIFGYGWLDASFKGVIATIHPQAGDDSNQNPNAWHLHTVALGFEDVVDDNGTPDDESDDTTTTHLCVQALGTDHGEGAQGGIKIKGNTISVNISAQQAGDVGEIGGIASFTAELSDNCASGVEVFPTNLVAPEE